MIEDITDKLSKKSRTRNVPTRSIRRTHFGYFITINPNKRIPEDEEQAYIRYLDDAGRRLFTRRNIERSLEYQSNKAVTTPEDLDIRANFTIERGTKTGVIHIHSILRIAVPKDVDIFVRLNYANFTRIAKEIINLGNPHIFIRKFVDSEANLEDYYSKDRLI